MRLKILSYIFINILILSSQCGCLLFELLIGVGKQTQSQPSHIARDEAINEVSTAAPYQQNKNVVKSEEECKNVDYDPIFSTKKGNIDISIKETLAGENQGSLKSDNTTKDSEVNPVVESVNFEDKIKECDKKAKDFIVKYFFYTSKTADFGNDYSLSNYNKFENFIKDFVEDVFKNIDKNEYGLFLYFCIINYFNGIQSPSSGTYSKEFGGLEFVKCEMNVKMRNLILLKMLCDVFDLNVISQDVKNGLSKIQFYTFISSYNIKSLFNYLTPGNFCKFFFDEDYFKRYKKQLDNLKNYKEIGSTTRFHNNNIVIRAFLGRFEIFKGKNSEEIFGCKDIFSVEEIKSFFIVVRKIIFHTSHLFMRFLYDKFGDCFLPLEKAVLKVAINNKDDFSKILNEALKLHDVKGKEDLYKNSYYNDAAKNCMSVIRNTTLILGPIESISKFVGKNAEGGRILKYDVEEEMHTLKNLMNMTPLEWLIELIENKEKVYTMSNKLTSLCNLYGQHKFLHYYLVKDDVNTIFPIQNIFREGIFFSKKKPIFICYKEILNRIDEYDDINNFKRDGLKPEVSTKANSLFSNIYYI